MIAIVELLASQIEPSSVAAIAAGLNLNRSTTTSILLALERAGWAVRTPERRYSLGAGLVGIAESARDSLPQTDRFDSGVDGLARLTGCGATLAMVGASEITFLSVSSGRGIPAGVGVGVRLPLIAPVGAAVIAHRDPRTQRAWLRTASRQNRRLFEGLLTQVRQDRVAVFGLGNADPKIFDVLAEVTELLAEHPRRRTLRQRVYELLFSLTGSPYVTKELVSEEELSISYMSAPVFDAGRPAYELQLGPLRPAVTRSERDHCIAELRSAAEQLSTP